MRYTGNNYIQGVPINFDSQQAASAIHRHGHLSARKLICLRWRESGVQSIKMPRKDFSAKRLVH